MINTKLGMVVQTRGVDNRRKEDAAFDEFVNDCFARYLRCDWGDTDEIDASKNNYALTSGDDRILAVYGKDTDNEIWIITEWDRSVTTVLFPSEY